MGRKVRVISCKLCDNDKGNFRDVESNIARVMMMNNHLREYHQDIVTILVLADTPAIPELEPYGQMFSIGWIRKYFDGIKMRMPPA